MEITGPDGERIIYAGDMGPSEMIIELARDTELLILEATLENGATDDTRRGHLDTPEAIDHVVRSNARQGILVHYWSERREIIRQLCAASGAPVEPGVTGMVVEVERGQVRVEAPHVAAWVPPVRPAVSTAS
jgi:ribonuclease BN (tRNA processing enzyme)